MKNAEALNNDFDANLSVSEGVTSAAPGVT